MQIIFTLECQGIPRDGYCVWGYQGVYQHIPISSPLRRGKAFQDGFIAGKLTKPVDFFFHPIDQRVKPVDTETNLNQLLVKSVFPAAVGQFMKDG